MKQSLQILGIILLGIVSMVGVIVGLVYGIDKIFPDKVYMTNDQIITETRKCQDAGLFASRWGTPGKIESINCLPNNENETGNKQNIKKSNITNINIEK